jgi:hypothetical protein
MKTQLFIENYEADISEDISTLLTYELDDVKDFSSRSTTWSKTIVLPGTSTNNKLFGHIFQPGQSNSFNEDLDNINYNFNASKAADCIIFQDQLQTFRGVLRLLQINNFKGKFEYEVAVFGELNGLNSALSGSLLENLDFSEYDHLYNVSGIVNSWENTSGVGVYYPLIDYGMYSIVKHDWDVRTFRPALHVKEYIDKMFDAAGYRYSSALFDSARFGRLIVPHNQKEMYADTTKYIDVNTSGTTQVYIPITADNMINFPNIRQINGFTPTNSDNERFNYDDPTTISVNIRVAIEGSYSSNGISLYVGIFRLRGAGPEELMGFKEFPSTGGATVAYDEVITADAVELQQNDDIYTRVYGFNISIASALTVTYGDWLVTPAGNQAVILSYGDPVIMNNMIPKNVRQIDFLVSIVKLFNLYVYQNQFDSRLIYFTPFVDFFSTDSADSIDWTYKMNRDKVIKVKPMSELNAKIYDFKYKPDTDYFNDQYKKRYGQGYGDYVFDSLFEFAEQKSSLELIFSATPLVGYLGEEKIYPTIFKRNNDNEERIDSNIRILQSKKITGVTIWDILDGASVLHSTTNYGYAGHFDDPDAPSNDLNFGALRELFFTLVSGDLTVTQFNVYWSSYMAEITDKDSKLLSAFFYLKTKDILDLDFSQKIFIDGVLFRLNKIKDFNVTRPTDCEVELIKVNYLIY